MGDVPVWGGYAYRIDADPSTDERRVLAEWQIDDFVRWCRTRGFDTILLERTKDTATYERPPAPDGVVHQIFD